MKEIINKFINKNQIEIYQETFEKLISSIDIDNEENRVFNKKYDIKKSDEQFNELVKKLKIIEENTGLNPLAIRIIIEQFLRMDIIAKGMNSNQMVYKSLNRTDIDDFPSSNYIFMKVLGGDKLIN